jgi:hypothetical protein
MPPFEENEMRQKLLLIAVSAFAISMAPVEFDPSAPGAFKISSAHAKSDKSGGNGNGNSGGNGSGKSSSGNSAGKSASSSGKQKSGKAASPRDALKSIFGGQTTKTASAGARLKKTASAQKAGGKVKPKTAKMQEVAALPDEMQVPTAVKQRNFHAKLAGLNSLKRNVNGLLNSQSPRMALIREFVLSAAAYDSAQVDLETATGLLSAAQSAFATAVDGVPVAAYGDATVYDAPTVAALEARRVELEALALSIDPVADPLAQPAIDAELTALTAVLDTAAPALATAETAAALAQEAAATAAAAIDDEALEAALVAAANKNRLAEYGDSYVDAEMIGWARDVLGVAAPAAPIEEVPEPVDPAL